RPSGPAVSATANGTNEVSMIRRSVASVRGAAVIARQTAHHSPALPAMPFDPIAPSPRSESKTPPHARRTGSASETASPRHPGRSLKSTRRNAVPPVLAPVVGDGALLPHPSSASDSARTAKQADSRVTPTAEDGKARPLLRYVSVGATRRDQSP